MTTAVPTTPADPPPPTSHAAHKPPNNLVGLALLAAFLACGYGLTRGVAPGILTFLFVMLGWGLSVMAHEFAHAIVAYMGGDHTVKAKGYLAFDPRRYGDLGTSFVLPLLFLALGGIGFPGGAVYVRTDLMRGSVWRAASALAGPFATLLVLLMLSTILRVWAEVGGDGAVYPALAFLAFLQGTALILNLMPIPGLDGFGVIRPFLPLAWEPGLRKVEGLVMIGFFLLIFLSPVAGQVLFGAGAGVTTALGVPFDAIRIGFDTFHFWR